MTIKLDKVNYFNLTGCPFVFESRQSASRCNTMFTKKNWFSKEIVPLIFDNCWRLGYFKKLIHKMFIIL